MAKEKKTKAVACELCGNPEIHVVRINGARRKFLCEGHVQTMGLVMCSCRDWYYEGSKFGECLTCVRTNRMKVEQVAKLGLFDKPVAEPVATKPNTMTPVVAPVGSTPEVIEFTRLLNAYREEHAEQWFKEKK